MKTARRLVRIVGAGMLAPLFLLAFHPYPASAQSALTQIGSFQLTATFKSISVYAGFSGDANDNCTTLLEYRSGSGPWVRGFDLVKDTRQTIISDGSSIPNPWVNQFRGSIVGLQPNTQYQVRVTFRDADGVTGTNPVVASITTRNDAFPLGNGRAYYVATNGNDTADGDLSHPWKTIQKAANTVSPGDTVYVRGGVYAETPYLHTSGMPGNYITFINYPGETPIVDCGNVDASVDSSRQTGGVRFYDPQNYTGVSYVRWSGINVRNAYHSAILLYGQADYNVIEYSDISDFGYISGDAGISVSVKSSFNVFRYNTIHTARSDYSDVLHRADGICFWYGPGLTSGRILGQNEGNIIYGNHFYSEGGMSDGVGGYANFRWYDGPYKDCDIYENTFERTLDDALELEGGNINVRAWSNTIISPSTFAFGNAVVVVGPLYEFRNLGYDLPTHGGSHKLGNPSNVYDGALFVFHNTFATQRPDSSDVLNSGGDYWGNSHFLNNIFDTTGRIFYVTATHQNNTFDYDLTFSPITAPYYWGANAASLAAFQTLSGQETHGTWGQPAFLDAPDGNFHLAAGSKGIGAGVVIPGFNDPNSAWPYSGTAPDIGAFECDSKAPPTNSSPVLATIGNKTVFTGTRLQFTISATDPDGNNLIYSASGLPNGATFDPTTRVFTWTPTTPGTYPGITFQVSDGSLTTSESILIRARSMPGLAELSIEFTSAILRHAQELRWHLEQLQTFLIGILNR